MKFSKAIKILTWTSLIEINFEMSIRNIKKNVILTLVLVSISIKNSLHICLLWQHIPHNMVCTCLHSARTTSVFRETYSHFPSNPWLDCVNHYTIYIFSVCNIFSEFWKNISCLFSLDTFLMVHNILLNERYLLEVLKGSFLTCWCFWNTTECLQ